MGSGSGSDAAGMSIDPIDPPDPANQVAGQGLEAGVMRWLEANGYPFELQVGEAAAAAGWKVQHSQPYKDPLEDKIREIDLVASVAHMHPPFKEAIEAALVPGAHFEGHTASVSLVIECKAAAARKPKAWIGFQSRHEVAPHWVLNRFPVGLSDAIGAVSRDVGRQASSLVPIAPGEVVHTVVRAFLTEEKSESVNEAFTAVMAAATAATALAQEESDLALAEGTANFRLSLIVPVVVVEAPLFKCRLEPAGKLALSRAKRLCVAVPNPSNPLRRLAVHVVQGEVIQEFCQSLIAAARAMTNSLAPLVKEVAQCYEDHDGEPPLTWFAPSDLDMFTGKE